MEAAGVTPAGPVSGFWWGQVPQVQAVTVRAPGSPGSSGSPGRFAERGVGQVGLLGVLGLCLCVVLGAGVGCGSEGGAGLFFGLASSLPRVAEAPARLGSGGRHLGRPQRTRAGIVVTCQGL